MNNGFHLGQHKTAFLDMEAVNKELPARPMREKPITQDEMRHWPWSPWGDDNLKPQQMADDIEKCGALTGIINMKKALSLCEGLQPAIIKSGEDGTRIIDKIVDDPELKLFLESSNHFYQTDGMINDTIGLGNGAIRFMADKEGKKIVAFQRLQMSSVRYAKRGADGYVKSVYISHEWDKVISPNDNRVYTLPLLREWAPWEHAKELMEAGVKEFVMTFRLPSFKDVYYSKPNWMSAYKWVKYAQAVPEVKAAEMDNSMRPAWLVTIYEGFWANHFEKWDTITDPAEKETLKLGFYTEVDNKLNGKANAGKNIYRTGEMSMEYGKAMAFIEFESLANKQGGDGKMLADAAAANSEIAFAEMMNLALMGGNQSAGPYTKNEGGSNIREGSLFQVVISELFRKYIQHVFNVPKYVNGWHEKYPGLEFIIFATALTTLDTGAGTKPISTGGVQPKNNNNGTGANNSGGEGGTPPAAE